jgi:hypothetical protein
MSIEIVIDEIIRLSHRSVIPGRQCENDAPCCFDMLVGEFKERRDDV